jgi:fumarylacetoacetate (FAA) hydrolase
VKLATLNEGGRDGTLVLVNRALTQAVRVPDIAPTLQAALDGWATLAPVLCARAAALEAGAINTAFAFDPRTCLAPLPRAYQWVDGSAYVNHVELVRKARGAELPASYWTEPLVYQGGSDDLQGPHAPILAMDEAHGIDFEAEVAVLTDDVPFATGAVEALDHIKLITLVNDVSLRNLIPAELAKGFGFYQAKPASAFAPVAITPDELGAAWREGKLHLPLRSFVNEDWFGAPECGVDMTFSFGDLVAHLTRTRRLCAGTVVGSGTVSNYDRSRGSSCIAERRMLETVGEGAPRTPFLRFGDRVRIEMRNDSGASLFGAIEQTVERWMRHD